MAYARPILTARMSQTDLLRIAAKFGLAASELGRSVAKAVNDTAKKGAAISRKRVRATVMLRAKRVKDAIQVAVRATPEDPSAVIVLDRHAKGRSNRPTLISFGGKPKNPPYLTKAAKKRRELGKKQRKRKEFSYQILKAGPRVILAGAFVALPTKRGTGTPGVSRAITDDSAVALAFRRSGRSRYPLNVPLGPSVAALWQNPANKIAVDVMTELNAYLPKRIHGRAQQIYDAKWKRVST